MAGRVPTEISLAIRDLTAEGLGVAEANERPYLVRNALPGEEVTARILKKRKGTRYADAVAVEGQAHSSRVTPSCAYFPRCGGCSLHHIDYVAGLALKHDYLNAQLEAAGVTPNNLHQPTTTGRLNYRRKARLGVRQVGEQVLVGFRESFSNRVSKSDSCQTLTREISSLISPLKEMLTGLEGGGRVPQIEVAQGDREVVLIIRHLDPLSAQDLRSIDAFARAQNVTVLLQSAGPDSVVSLDGEPVPLLDYALPEFGLHYQFDPRQFTQVNAKMNETLVSHAMTYLQPKPGEHFVDLFCGIGNFSLPIARVGASVTGFELDASAIERASQNSAHNGLSQNTSFHVHDLYSAPLNLKEDGPLGQIHGLLLDPPRSGAGPHLREWLASSSISRVVYISCNPKTFATDALQFAAQGFQLDHVGAYDMFPNTSHVETLGVFVRAQDNG